MIQTKPDNRIEMLLKASENLVNKVGDHEVRITYMENNMIMNSRKALNIKNLVSKHITKLLGGHGTDEYKENYRKYIRRLWHDYWNTFGVTSYRDTPARLYDVALDWVQDWRYREDEARETKVSR